MIQSSVMSGSLLRACCTQLGAPVTRNPFFKQSLQFILPMQYPAPRRVEIPDDCAILEHTLYVKIVLNGGCGQTKPPRLVGCFKTLKFRGETIRAIIKALLQALESSRQVQRHVLNFPHGHSLASVGSSNRAMARRLDAVRRQSRPPHANHDDAAVIFGRNGENLEHGQLRFHAVTEHQFQPFRQIRASRNRRDIGCDRIFRAVRRFSDTQ